MRSNLKTLISNQNAICFGYSIWKMFEKFSNFSHSERIGCHVERNGEE